MQIVKITPRSSDRTHRILRLNTKAAPCNGSATADTSLASCYRSFVLNLQKFVQSADKKTIATLIAYPLRVTRAVKNHRLNKQLY
jgi:hypothetical protein